MKRTESPFANSVGRAAVVATIVTVVAALAWAGPSLFDSSTYTDSWTPVFLLLLLGGATVVFTTTFCVTLLLVVLFSPKRSAKWNTDPWAVADPENEKTRRTG